MKQEKIRAISWWLTWNDLQWPDDDVADAIERRADTAAKSGANCAVIFGAHFRWDFLPLWQNLHDLLGTIGNALHQRGIMLFDHHSSVLTHRYSTREEALAMRTFNRHHVPFAPSRDIASEWTYKGHKLDDWRMIDVSTGKPFFLKPYTAEEFCINNLEFRDAYYDYVRRLVAETGIDGLMSDDGIFYPGWNTCACRSCRDKFRNVYGHELPPVSDTSFWGNYSSEAFKDWIEMRFASTREFLEGVRGVLKKDYPMMTCCSNSVDYSLAQYGLTYQEFIKPCNYIMLEMTGNTPSLDGTWGLHFPDQIMHIGMARDNAVPCLGLGYGYTEPVADFIWAFNKFLGSSSWFSTLKGRLGLPDSKMSVLKDDSELVGNGFNWEKAHGELFEADTDTETAVFFSRWSRDFYSMTAKDYFADYSVTCSYLLNKNITFDVVASIPEVGKYKTLIVSSASCLDDGEYAALNRFIADGGIVIASGPVGCYNRRGNKPEQPWLAQYGIDCTLSEPERRGAFPPWSLQQDVMPACSGTFHGKIANTSEWCELTSGKGRLFWSSGRMQEKSGELLLDSLLHELTCPAVVFPEETCAGWCFRVFKNSEGRLVVHGLAELFDVDTMHELEKQRKNPRGNHIITSLARKNAMNNICIGLRDEFSTATFYAPLSGNSEKIAVKNRQIKLELPEDVYYFILELEHAGK